MAIEKGRDRTLAEAAEELGIDVSTARHQLRNGKLRGTKFGPVWAIPEAEIARYRSQSRGKPGRRAAK